MNVSERNQCAPALPRGDTNSHARAGGRRMSLTATTTILMARTAPGQHGPRHPPRTGDQAAFAAASEPVKAEGTKDMVIFDLVVIWNSSK